MTRVSRLAGAILVEDGEAAFLVGDLKRPCDWAAAGFADPGAIDARERPWIELPRREFVPAQGEALELALGGRACAELLARRLLIARTAGVSERLWSLLSDDAQPSRRVDWLAEVPDAVWDCVRESVLRCA